MVDKSIKRIWLICLCLVSLSLAGCFHIPDDDWLPSKNKVNTWIKEDGVEQALNSFINWVDTVSQRKETKNDEVNEMDTHKDELSIEIENLDNEEANIEE